MRTFVSVLLCALALALSSALSRAGNEITFAIPEDGLITLGVFDSSGHLVRTLHSLQPEDNFRKGLNGLVTNWDGCDDSGKNLPPGHYHIRGYLIPDLTVEGVDYHFNDWLAELNAPPLAWIQDFAVLSNESFLILGNSPGGELICARYNQDSGFAWTTFLKGDPPASIASTTSVALIKTSTTWRLLSVKEGDISTSSLPVAAPDSVQAFSVIGDDFLLAAGNRLERFPAQSETVSPPARFNSLATSGKTVIGSSDAGVFISSDGAAFQKIPLPVLVSSLSAVDDSTFWFSGRAMDPDASPLVAQANHAGEILRMLSTESGLPIKVCALPDGTGFIVLEQSDNTQSLRLIQRSDQNAWEILWNRTIQDAPGFGFSAGSVVQNVSPESSEKFVRIRLSENPLTGDRGDISIMGTPSSRGTFVVTEDNLPIAQISERRDITRIAICRGSTPDSLRLLQGNGAGAEEFLIQGLGGIIPLNVGGIDLP